MRFAVITRVPPPEDGGNMATALGSVYLRDGAETLAHKPVPVEVALNLSVPVFTLGEVLILAGDREPVGRGRKPSKWDVEYEVYDRVEAAVARARQVLVDAAAERMEST